MLLRPEAGREKAEQVDLILSVHRGTLQPHIHRSVIQLRSDTKIDGTIYCPISNEPTVIFHQRENNHGPPLLMERKQ